MEIYQTEQLTGQPFSFSRLYMHPGPISGWDTPGERKRICIIGAGISGLAAAYELQSCDHDVTIYEASERAGGRIKTHSFRNGTYGELGAMRIPANHAITLHYIDKFGLNKRAFVNHNPNAFSLVNGKRVRLSDWRTLAQEYELRRTEYLDPYILYENCMKEAWAFLSADEKWSIFTSHLDSLRLAAYDKRSLRQELEKKLSEDAIRYIGRATGMLQYQYASFLETIIDYFGLFRVDQYEIEGGMEQITNAFCANIRSQINYAHKVKAITVTQHGVHILGEYQRNDFSDHFDYAICCIPAPQTKLIQFTPELSARKRDSLDVHYANSAKTLFSCNSRPWELNEGVYGGGSFFDTNTQSCWYPSDNASPLATSGLLAGFTGDDFMNYSKAPVAFSARSAESSHEPGCLTASYTWEENATRFGSMDSADRLHLIQSDIRRVHHHIDSAIDEVAEINWGMQECPGFGAFAYFSPGEHGRRQKGLCEPHPLESPRVFFAGEHLSISHAWIQGAIQTGLAAAYSIVAEKVVELETN
ncbi:MAG: NAD(P)/FAD-dependent oxidoreductase [Planctomycetota bacterium]